MDRSCSVIDWEGVCRTGWGQGDWEAGESAGGKGLLGEDSAAHVRCRGRAGTHVQTVLDAGHSVLRKALGCSLSCGNRWQTVTGASVPGRSPARCDPGTGLGRNSTHRRGVVPEEELGAGAVG